jgi:N-acetylmuramoyl-L-alanine amidase
MTMRVFKLGDRGQEIVDIQFRLTALGAVIDGAERDGTFGPSTEIAVRAFQQDRHLRVDGLVGSDTWQQLVEAGWRLGDRTLYIRAPMFRGDDVLDLQRKLNALGFDAGKEDGLYGPRTDAALRQFQRNVGDEPDGVVGPHTLSVIRRMRPLEAGPSRAMVREREELTVPRAPIEGRVVVVDVGDGPEDGSDVHRRAAEIVVAELRAAGADARMIPVDGDPRSPSDRARAANDADASAIVTIELTMREDEGGPACSYFGSRTTHSPSGLALAQLILEELEAALELPGHVQPLTIAQLRETRMPAVQVELIVGPRERARFAHPEAPSSVGRAVAAGIRRFFSG